MRNTTTLVLLALASATIGCADLSFVKQDVIIRHDVEGDAAEVLLVHHGVFTNLPEASSDAAQKDRTERLDRGVAAIERIAAGAREGAIGDEIIGFSIDELAADAAKSNDTEAAQRVAIYRMITLEDHAVFVDDEKRLCCFQRFKIQPWSEFEAGVNALLSLDVIESAASKSKPEDDDPVGEAMRVAKAKAGSPWFALKNGQFLLDVPMTHAEYARGVRGFIGEPWYPLNSLLGEVIVSAALIRFDEHGLAVVIGDGKVPIHWEVEPGRNAYDPTLCEAVHAKGVEIRDDVKGSDLIAAMK